MLHRPELEGLGEMIGAHVVGAVEIRNRPRDGADAVVAARAEAEPGDRALNETGPGAIERAVARRQRRRQFGVRANGQARVPLALTSPRTDHSLAHSRRLLARRLHRQHIGRQCRDIDHQIESIAQRT
jgi:hypothetical protein